jgi:hypothetical protein
MTQLVLWIREDYRILKEVLGKLVTCMEKHGFLFSYSVEKVSQHIGDTK